MKLFEGKVALVTGAGGGTGLATASAFAKAGASVVVADSNATLIEAAADGLRSAGHEILTVNCDVTDRNQVRGMVDQAVGSYGRLDAAFNNAGINCDGAPMLETEDEEFDNILDVNPRGVWNCMKAELRQMMPQGSGAIVNCSSIGNEGIERARRLFGQQIRDHWPYSCCSPRLCWSEHPHQCRVSGDHRQHADGDEGNEEQRS
jgi:NAD(P)-dependent dehydrogenase (short-subunit alcohol dehydrogenase family)